MAEPEDAKLGAMPLNVGQDSQAATLAVLTKIAEALEKIAAAQTGEAKPDYAVGKPSEIWIAARRRVVEELSIRPVLSWNFYSMHKDEPTWEPLGAEGRGNVYRENQWRRFVKQHAIPNKPSDGSKVALMGLGKQDKAGPPAVARADSVHCAKDAYAWEEEGHDAPWAWEPAKADKGCWFCKPRLAEHEEAQRKAAQEREERRRAAEEADRLRQAHRLEEWRKQQAGKEEARQRAAEERREAKRKAEEERKEARRQRCAADSQNVLGVLEAHPEGVTWEQLEALTGLVEADAWAAVEGLIEDGKATEDEDATPVLLRAVTLTPEAPPTGG